MAESKTASKAAAKAAKIRTNAPSMDMAHANAMASRPSPCMAQ